MPFIVLEGLDGAGKSTQINRVKTLIEGSGHTCRYLHFPRFETPVYGDLVARFLRGEFGAIDAVDPYLVALIYAGDRQQAATEISGWLAAGDIVLVDRYVASNIAYQCAKVADPAARKTLRDWIVNLEYAFHNIPRPDRTLFLDVPFSFTRKKLAETREGDDRDYLCGKSDIHEASLPFQERVREVYLAEAVVDPSLKVVPCADDRGNMLPPDAIFEKLKAQIEPFL